MKKIIYSFIILSIFILPLSSFAQTNTSDFNLDPLTESSVGSQGAFGSSTNIMGSQAIFTPPTATTSVVSGCALPPSPKIGDLLNFITCNISASVVPLIFVLASMVFVWGVVQYVILGAEEESKRAKGRQFMIWGIVALAVMVSIWGLVNVLTNTFGISNGPAVIPQLQEH